MNTADNSISEGRIRYVSKCFKYMYFASYEEKRCMIRENEYADKGPDSALCCPEFDDNSRENEDK
jgi:hypothetical protein